MPAVILIAGVYAAPVQKCEICHAKPGFHTYTADSVRVPLYVPPDSLAQSVHKERECTDCHRDVVEIPHKPGLQRVDCTACHYVGNLMGAPELPIYEQYRESVHGQAARAGDRKAPVCQDCHGAHNIHPPDSPESPLHHRNIPELCGRCHLPVYSHYINSIHGRLLREGNDRTPTCTDCHGEHTIASPKAPESQVFPANIPETCGHCHAAETIVGPAGLTTEQVVTYTESFHGIASEFGSTTAANCASCHGAHDILPPTDPNSSIYPANIPQTCGACHPQANANWARGKIHVNPKSPEAGIIYYVASFFKWLTILTLAGLIINIILDLARRLLGHKKRAH
jgi:DnaJ-class molecular chaperone